MVHAQSRACRPGTKDPPPPAVSPRHLYRLHASQVQGETPWVTASGLRGEADIAITLAKESPEDARPYTVRLYFCEIEDVRPGQRRFHVQLQDKRVLSDLDIVAAAGAPRRGMVRELRRIDAGERLTISLRTAQGSSLPPLLSGIELIADGW